MGGNNKLKSLKRKRDPEVGVVVVGSDFDGSSIETPSGDPGTPEGGGGGAKKKKVRTTFTGRQIFELEKMFENKKYLSSSERADMAKLLNVTEQQVRN